MRKAVRYLCLFFGVVIMLTLFGCGKQKYKLNFDGYGFESKKTVYAAGAKVRVQLNLIATDTDYKFWIDDDVDMSKDYDHNHGYVFTFTMPDHDVTLHMSSRNSMLPREEDIGVTLINAVDTADFWILPQSDENLKTSLWGKATAKNLEAGTQCELTLTKTDEDDLFIVRIIDSDHAYFSANDIRLDDGYSIRFKTEDSKFDAVIEILDADGKILNTQGAFVGMLGAE